MTDDPWGQHKDRTVPIDHSMTWSSDKVGFVTPAGNIIGSAPGTAWAFGTVLIPKGQLAAAIEAGWRKGKNCGPWVEVTRDMPPRAH